MGKIVWIASYPKSGNTWVRAFLHNYLAPQAAPRSINALEEVSITECAAALYHAPGATPPPEQVQALRPAVHERLTRLRPGPVFVKTHNANLALHGVPLCTPAHTAGALYMVRDPRDIALSFAAYTGRDVDEIIAFMENAGAANASDGAQVIELLSDWSAHVRSWVAAPNRLLTRYEDLLAAPERYFARIIRFLGASEVDAQRLTRAIEFSSFKSLSAQEAAEGYRAGGKGKFFRQGQAGQWRECLTPVQAQRITAAHGEVMRELGYL